MGSFSLLVAVSRTTRVEVGPPSTHTPLSCDLRIRFSLADTYLSIAEVIGIATQHPRTVHQVGKSEVTEWQTVPICGVNPQPNRRVNINMRLAYFVECKSELSRGRVVKFDRGVGMYNVDFGDVEGEGIVVRHDGDGLWRREGEEGT